MVVDEMARISNGDLTLMLAALCHDLGKPSTTIVGDKITAFGHMEAGIAPTIKLLTTLKISKDIIEVVCKLVQEHLFHASITTATKRIVNRLADRLHPANIQQLAKLIEADKSGRYPLPKGCPSIVTEVLDLANTMNLSKDKPKALVTGKHFLDKGFKPGKEIGVMVKKAYELQLDESINDIDILVNMVIGG